MKLLMEMLDENIQRFGIMLRGMLWLMALYVLIVTQIDFYNNTSAKYSIARSIYPTFVCSYRITGKS